MNKPMTRAFIIFGVVTFSLLAAYWALRAWSDTAAGLIANMALGWAIGTLVAKYTVNRVPIDGPDVTIIIHNPATVVAGLETGTPMDTRILSRELTLGDER